MEKYKPLFLALAVAILFLPLAFFVRKFTQISRPVYFNVTFDPISCYRCRDCPCEFTLDNNKKYILNSRDKTICKVGHEEINRGIKEGMTNMTVEMKVPDYRKFLDCVTWYSQHPSTY